MEQHTLHYEVLNVFEPGETGQHWDVEVHATPEELQTFAETGYLIRENLFQGAALHKLRDALDQLEEREWEGRDSAIASKHGWGFIPRHLMDKDEAFLELLKISTDFANCTCNDGTACPSTRIERTNHLSRRRQATSNALASTHACCL